MVFALTENVTVPFPLPLVPAVTVIHDAEVDADHAQPMGAATPKVLEPLDADNDRLVGLTVYVHGTANANEFDGVLAVVPVLPIAVTLTSYSTPPAGIGMRIVFSAMRMTPAVLGVGFPRSTVRSGVEEPSVYSRNS